jgi:hypothetical protein
MLRSRHAGDTVVATPTVCTPIRPAVDASIAAILSFTTFVRSALVYTRQSSVLGGWAGRKVGACSTVSMGCRPAARDR